MDNRSIGVFDSGVGGLSVVKQLHSLMPFEDILYLGDTGRVPYGTRSSQTIRKYAAQDISYLLKNNVKAIVTACGTVSSNVADSEIADFGVNVAYTGVVNPSAKSAYNISTEKRIGVIATPATIRSKAFEKAVYDISKDAAVFAIACPLLVPLVENGMIQRDNKITQLTLQMYLEPFAKNKIDTLILGCTHFPLLYDIINDTLEYKVTLIDSGAAAASHIKAILENADALNNQKTYGQTQYHVTDTVESFVGVARYFLNKDIEKQTTFVNIES